MALESGRYMETVGWLSKHTVLFQEAFSVEEYTGAKLDKKGSTGNITFSRRYLDTNIVTYKVSHLILLWLYSLKQCTLDSITLAQAAKRLTRPWANQSRKVLTSLPCHSTSVHYSVSHPKTIFSLGVCSFHLNLWWCWAQRFVRAPYPSDDSVLTLLAQEVSARHDSCILPWDIYFTPTGPPCCSRDQ